ncbi:FKBP-type peptidyl-prolyl cis-trans isomerase [Streptomyces olivoverticillatus]|uniref:peptidylprolyl isomerase n=1 Tax=Streptomyces olivoverticillatus TaxID=66427 RepID=A0A7W7LRH1_9ACTN|nr:FKBP-type peptidyl-prolyl cis-trans isomerase [Streptomyces olivoverticillatus]MBB4895005.1 FKBP-type peptidyl-prolyl cis-trans isomerase [Streptomyces olivoverticillatus]
MNHTKNARRLAAALAVPVLLLTAAACGSDKGGGSSDAKVKVTGSFGQKPEISAPKDAKPADKLVVKTLTEGKGEKAEKGSFVRLDFAGQTMKDNKPLGGTWETQDQPAKGPRRQMVQQLGQPSQEMPAKVLDAVVGQKAGSRIEVEGTAKALIGDQLNPQAGVKPEDGLIWVIDVVGAQKVDSKAEVKGDMAKPESGMPEVKINSQKAADITIPKDEKAPSDLKEQVLIKGSGAEVKAGDGLIAQYTGVKWEDGQKFDSSWDHSGATAFQIGTGSVVKGWDQGLVGKHVGDRVLLVIPPKLGYEGQAQSGLDKNTLVFVVDIVGKA